MRSSDIRKLTSNSVPESVGALIVKARSDSFPECVGTVFFICDTGIFLTAKHCVLDLDHQFNDDGEFEELELGLFVSQFFPGNKSITRRVLFLSGFSDSDVMVGVVEKWVTKGGDVIPTPGLPLSARDAKPGDTVQTYAFPNTKNQGKEIHLSPKAFQGEVVEDLRDGRDRMLRNPCYLTSMEIPSGASGGPVFNLLGSVIGVNSTGYDIGDGGEPISFVSKLHGLEAVKVPDREIDKLITIGELIQLGKIRVHVWDNTGLEIVHSEKPPNWPTES